MFVVFTSGCSKYLVSYLSFTKTRMSMHKDFFLLQTYYQNDLRIFKVQKHYMQKAFEFRFDFDSYSNLIWLLCSQRSLAALTRIAEIVTEITNEKTRSQTNKKQNRVRQNLFRRYRKHKSLDIQLDSTCNKVFGSLRNVIK